jgi:hypothetical protein
VRALDAAVAVAEEWASTAPSEELGHFQCTSEHPGGIDLAHGTQRFGEAPVVIEQHLAVALEVGPEQRPDTGIHLSGGVKLRLTAPALMVG